MRTAVRVFFKEIHITGLSNIPKNKPVIFAANHNSAFMDAVALAVFIEPQVYFLTRSDVFNTPLKRWILKKMNMLPIYRLQEGAENLHKNEQVFSDCYQLLAQNKSILIFSEGICIQEKRLQRLKKGTARIAFGAEVFKNFKLDLQIIPVGINYNKPSQFRSNLQLKIAPALNLKPYEELWNTDENKAAYVFTRDLEKVMEMQIVHLKEKSSDTFYDEVIEINNNLKIQNPYIDKKRGEDIFWQTREIANLLNELNEKSKEEFTQIAKASHHYFKNLHKHQLKDKTIANAPNTKLIKLAFKVITALLLFPIHMLSLSFNYIPYKLPYIIAKKTCKHIEFVASVILGIGAFLFLFSFLFWGFVLTAFMSSLAFKIAAFFIVPFLAWFSLYYYSFLKNLRMEFQLFRNKMLSKKLIQERDALINILNPQVFQKIKDRSKLRASV